MVTPFNQELHRRSDEPELAYIFRIGTLKSDGTIDMTWSELAEVFNRELRSPDEYFTESAYRKRYNLIRDAYEQIFSGYQDDQYLRELKIQQQEIQKERRKLYDERLDLNKRLREEARLETTIECLRNSLHEIADTHFPTTEFPVAATDGNKLIVCLSDWHIGQNFDTVDGNYDSHTASDRLAKYLNEIRKIAANNDCNECVVCLLGDLISGSIHNRISITNKENVVDQVKTAAMLVTGFIHGLSPLFSSIRVYSVGGNHSRLEKCAEDALLSERLDSLIPWFVSESCKNCGNVTVFGKTFDDTLGIFDVGEKTYFIQHGDFSKCTDADVGKLILWAKRTPYCILTGHMHYPAMTDVSGITVIQSGSLCGSGDDYTRSKRLTGKPSQTSIVTKSDGSIYGVYPIDLS